MKSPASAFPWLVVPLAAAAGFYGGHARQDHPAVSLAGSASPSAQAGAAKPSSSSSATSPPGMVKTWADRLRNLPAADLPGVFAEIQNMPDNDNGQKRVAMRLLCARWAEVDAAGGLAFLTDFIAHAEPAKRSYLNTLGRMWILAEWALRDQDAVRQAIMAFPEQDRENALNSVGTVLQVEDQDSFWAWFQKTRRPLPDGWGKDVLWEKMADAHFDELAALAAEMAAAEPKDDKKSGPFTKVEGLYATLSASLARKDPDNAVAWAREQPEHVRTAAIRGALGVIAKRSPERIVEFLPLLKNKQTGPGTYQSFGAEQILKTAMDTMSARDPLQALDWLGRNSGKLGNSSHMASRDLGETFAAALRDGKFSIAQAFEAVREGKGDAGILNTVANAMFRSLPAERMAEAAEFLKGVDSKETRSMALQGLLPAWAAVDSEAALAFARGLGDETLAKSVFSVMVSNLGNQQIGTYPENMLAALGKIPPEYQADVLEEQVRMQYSVHMPDHGPPFDGPALGKALEGLPPSEATDKAVAAVTAFWGATDPRAALTWAAGQADPGIREKAAGTAMEAWATEDAMGASQWIDAQPPGEQRDIAAHHLARVLRTAEPESAWTWAASIGDPATRLEAQAAVLRKWRDSSAVEAQAAVDAIANTLPPADRQRLADTLQRRDSAK